MTHRGAATLVLALSVGMPMLAQAQERKSPLADAPAIRRRLELRDQRFEIGAGVGSTVGQDFYHAVVGTLRASYHLSDWLAVGGLFGFNMTPDLKTGFHDRLAAALPDKSTDRTPTLAAAEGSMNKIGWLAGLQLEIIPITGKYSLFDRLFMNYDFYAFGGPGFINFKADAECPATAGPSCAVTGMRVGANLGLGMRTYINDHIAINAEARNLLVRNNPAGRDITGDRVVDGQDTTWDANYLFTVNVTFFLPSKAEKSP